MEAILVKVFATAIALSQVMTRPDAVKTEFDPIQDKAEVVQLLSDGCSYMRKAFDIENIDLDDLIDTVMTDTRASADEVKGFRGLKFEDLHLAYRQFCKKEKLDNPAVDVGEVIAFFNKTVGDLPDHTKLKNVKLPGLTTVNDVKGGKYAELFEPDNRRIWVPLSEIPAHVQNAFIAAEDKRFYKHKGVDERSVIRAFMSTMADPKKRQGGSTITQQVAKNLLVGDDVTYERKIREILVAARVEQAVSKQEILEIYLNAIFLGRGSWGIEMAARSYFGKSASQLTIAEGAFLAGLTKGPNYYNPDKYRDRAHERLAYVLDRMLEDGAITAEQMKQAQADRLVTTGYVRPRRDSGFALVEHLRREAGTLPGVGSLTAASYEVRSTIHPQIQRAAEIAVQEGLARYEQRSGRVNFTKVEGNLGDAIRRITADPKADKSKPAWRVALEAARPRLYDVHWHKGVVVDKIRLKSGHESIMVGLPDGRTLPLSTSGGNTRRLIGLHDLIFVNLVEGRGKEGTRLELRTPSTVQASAVVLENQTGRILAMVGGFSFPQSQLNRATQTRRQPGSSFKPMTYLAALSAGLQPNTLIQDGPITLPPIGDSRYSTEKDWWSPKNYDGGYSGTMTLRRALEQSKNLVTARLLDGGIAGSAPESLDMVCKLATEAHIYQKCERYYPFVLGSQPVRLIDLAAFYASISNEGMLPTPYSIDSVEKDGRTIYKHNPTLTPIASTDRPAAFQLKSILQGVVARGTAASMSRHSQFIAGKTGTSDEENDAWFVGFSNEVTIAVWVGYDNARGKRTLGGGQTGGKVAIPIFEPIMQAVWEQTGKKTVLRGPSPEAAKQLVAMSINRHSGDRIQRGAISADGTGTTNAFTEYFRLDSSGHYTETQNRLVSRDTYYSNRDDTLNDRGNNNDSGWIFPWSSWGNNNWNDRGSTPSPSSSSRGWDDRTTVYEHGATTTTRPYRSEPESTPFFGEPRRQDPRQQQQTRQDPRQDPRYYQQRQETRPDPRQDPRARGQQRRVEPDPRRGDGDFFWGQRRTW
jgi:1A family penicillin-binding protein